ncbi:uncharacterized protein [Amphiura filiformis]|uniref:uncharacterized protein n=1 Tax=Amphiura filiformis TaxID=82378 RepID=UPI003B21C871
MSDILDFNLGSVRRQLKAEYLETRGKLPLLPGMPEKFAKMEDLFVNLHIEEHRKPFGVLSRELKSAGDIVCIERKLGKEETELVKRILVKGVPGAGKSSTISKLAYDWACGRQNSPISKFQLLFALTINEIDTNTDLIGIIQDQLLPEVSGESLRAYIQSNASEVVILLDGYDEASKYFHQCKNISNVLRSKWLAEACVIVTTRSNQVGKFCQNYGPYLQVHIPGFSQFGVKEYIRKFFKLHQEANDYDVSDDAEKLPSTVTALHTEVITHLAKHTFAKTATDELDVRSVQNWSERVLDHIGNVAIEGLFEDRLVFQSDEFEKAALEDACSLGVVTKEKKSYKLNVTYHVTFLHKTFQEICAAYYWTKLIDTEMETFKKYLMQVTGDNIDEMEYLLRFACGLSVKAAEVILPHVVQSICNDCKWKDTAGYVNFYNNIYLQIPIFLLYETESNNTEIGQCSELYMLLKPLLKSVCLERSDQGGYKEFQEILNLYIVSKEQKIDRKTSHGHSWVHAVEEVTVRTFKNVDKDAELVCALSLSGMSGLCLGDNMYHDVNEFLDTLVTKHFSIASLTKLQFDHAKCDAKRLSHFISNMSPHSKLAIFNMSLCGEFFDGAMVLPALKKLHIRFSPEVIKAILSGFSQTADIIQRQNVSQSHSNQKSTAVQTYIPIEAIRIESSSLEHDDVCKFVKAIKYMLHLKKLRLRLNNSLRSEDCNMLFDALADASKNAHTCDQAQGNMSSSGERYDRGLLLETLELSHHEIGDAIDKFARVYSKHMPHLICLNLSGVSLKVHHCEKLFDGFIEAGQAREDGLVLEVLDLSYNKIGDSAGKLAQAYRYMTCLRCLKLEYTNMNPSQCAQLFDGFLQAGQLKDNHDEKKKSDDLQQSGTLRPNCLTLEELDISGNDIGDSVGKLTQAYKPEMFNFKGGHYEGA